jgi:hypothetical protein
MAEEMKYLRGLMEPVIYEDRIKYDRWIKAVLVLPVVLFIILGVLFYIDAKYSDIFPRETARKAIIASIDLFVAAPLVLVVYRLSLPRTIYIFKDRIRIKFGAFFFNIPFETVESVKAAKGIISRRAISSTTSFSTQIEIVRKRQRNIRVSPSQREQFLGHANRALSDWRQKQRN